MPITRGAEATTGAVVVRPLIDTRRKSNGRQPNGWVTWEEKVESHEEVL
jgi:hypothetical protein